MPCHFSLEPSHIFSFLGFVKHEALLKINLDFLVRRDREVVEVAIICTNHSMNDHRVLLVSVLEENVQILVKVKIEPRYLERVFEICEIVILIKGYREQAHSEYRYSE